MYGSNFRCRLPLLPAIRHLHESVLALYRCSDTALRSLERAWQTLASMPSIAQQGNPYGTPGGLSFAADAMIRLSRARRSANTSLSCRPLRRPSTRERPTKVDSHVGADNADALTYDEVAGLPDPAMTEGIECKAFDVSRHSLRAHQPARGRRGDAEICSCRPAWPWRPDRGHARPRPRRDRRRRGPAGRSRALRFAASSASAPITMTLSSLSMAMSR